MINSAGTDNIPDLRLMDLDGTVMISNRTVSGVYDVDTSRSTPRVEGCRDQVPLSFGINKILGDSPTGDFERRRWKGFVEMPIPAAVVSDFREMTTPVPVSARDTIAVRASNYCNSAAGFIGYFSTSLAASSDTNRSRSSVDFAYSPRVLLEQFRSMQQVRAEPGVVSNEFLSAILDREPTSATFVHRMMTRESLTAAMFPWMNERRDPMTGSVYR